MKNNCLDRKGLVPYRYVTDLCEGPITSTHWEMVLLLLFSRQLVSNSLWPHGLQHTRLLCPSLSLEFAQTHIHWVGEAIQPSHLPSSPSPPAFNLSQHQGLSQWVSSSHQTETIGVSASVLPMNTQDWFPLRLTGWISLLVEGTLKSLLQHHSSKASILLPSAFFMGPALTSAHDYWKNHSFD